VGVRVPPPAFDSFRHVFKIEGWGTRGRPNLKERRIGEEGSVMSYEISVNELSESRRGVGAKIPRAVYDKKMSSMVQSISQRVELKGFRKGKAPVSMVQKLYGEQIRADLLEEIWRDIYQEAVTSNGLQVVGVSNLHFHDEDPAKDVHIHAEFALVPRPKLANIKGLEITVETEKFTDKLVEDAIEEIRRRSAKVQPIEGRETAENGDLVNISFEATLEGEEFPGNKEESSYVEIGSGRSVSDLENGLVGLKVGEKKEITVKFPEEYSDKNLAGKSALYKVEVKTIERVELPELTDEFVKENLQDENVADFKAKLTTRIERRLKERNHAAQIDALVKAIFEANTFEIPDAMVDEQIRMKLFEFGVLDPKDRNSYGRDVSRFRPMLGEVAKNEVTKAVIFERLVEELQVEPTDAEIDSWVEAQAASYETTVEQIRKEFQADKNNDRLKDVVARERAVEQILAESKVIEQPKA